MHAVLKSMPDSLTAISPANDLSVTRIDPGEKKGPESNLKPEVVRTWENLPKYVLTPQLLPRFDGGEF